MKIILSIDPIRYPLTGIGRYTLELARGLLQSGLEDLQFMQDTKLQSFIPVHVDSSPHVKLPAWKEHLRKSSLVISIYRILKTMQKRRTLKGMEDYLFHGPNYYLPPFGGRSIVTIHDLSLYLMPQSHPPERVRYMKAEIRLSLKRATALITDTEYTRQEAARFLSWPLEKIYSVPLASGPEFRPRSDDELKGVLQSFNLKPRQYTLFVGTIEPRKNIDTLIDAYERLPERVRLRFPLVIAGYEGWNSEKIHARMEGNKQKGWLRYLGFVPNDILPLLMSGARLFAYPSLYEGFGLPVLEAMASGVPVVCSNASTLPEVAGKAAAFHDPLDVDSLTLLLKRGLEDELWRSSATNDGIAQAAGFSWERCVKETLDVYKAVLNKCH